MANKAVATSDILCLDKKIMPANLELIRPLPEAEKTFDLAARYPRIETTEAQFLAERIKRTWDSLQLFFQAETSGFPADRLELNHDEVEVHPQTKPTNIGLGLVCLVAAERLGLVSESEAKRRLEQILGSLRALEQAQGFFYDWYDSRSGEKLTQWPDGGHELNLFLSSVDNAWLAMSLLTVQKAKPELANTIQNDILEKMDFDFFFDCQEQELWGGFSVSQGKPSNFHYPRQFISEPRIIHWVKAALTVDQEARLTVLRRLFDQDGEIPDQVAGGAMFELLMPRLFLREKYLDASLDHAFDHHKEYGRTHLNGSVGISVADDPINNNRYCEMGVGGLYKSCSVISSHGMALSILMDPELAEQTMRQAEQFPGFYGKYGYNDAVDLKTGAVTNTQIFIDQAMVFLSLFSRFDDYLRKMFLSYFENS